MSSNEEDYNEGEGHSGAPHGLKKRRIQRACDICRRKKSDGVQMPGNRCSNCTAYGLDCTYVETAKKRGPSKGYVEGLENKVERMEKLLRRLCPDPTVYQSILSAMEKDDGTLESESIDPMSLMAQKTMLKTEGKSHTMLDTLTNVIRDSYVGSFTGVEDEDDFSAMVSDLRCMSIEPYEYRFFGKSSGALLIKDVFDAKRDYTGPAESHLDHLLQSGRPEFWHVREWEKARYMEPPKPFNYPAPDLAEELINHYFRHANLYFPLLHAPTFRAAVEANLHEVDIGFASVYLLVCSLGSRFSDDRRVLLDGEESFHSAGWKWFQQVIAVPKTPMAAPTLYDIQTNALSVQFLAASTSPQTCWSLIGIGIRQLLDVGAHRRRPWNRSRAEDELWKRAFWVLLVMDRIYSAALGRPGAIYEEDFDIGFPTDCDDEYWDTPDSSKAFQQPQGKPSKVTAFILLIKLMRMVSVTLRTIYAINKSKMILGYRVSWEQTIVTELDSALNAWVDLVPPHLRWDPNREDLEFFDQSVALYANYYFLQILVHRPFIPTPNKPSRSSFPSLAICANASRSCSHLADLQRRRTMLAPIVQSAVCTAGIVLLLNLWSGKRSGLSLDIVKKDMEDVHMCMEALKSTEDRWKPAGRLWDILYELAYAGDLPLPKPKSTPKNKRARGSDVPAYDTEQGQDMNTNAPRNFAGSKRVQKESNLQQHSQFPQQDSPTTSSTSQHPSPSNSSTGSEPSVGSSSSLSSTMCSFWQASHCGKLQLPMYTNELGRLPLHGPFTFVAPQQAQVAAQPTPPAASADSWYQLPMFGDSCGGNDPLSTAQSTAYSTSIFQSPFPSTTGLLGEMASLTGGSSSDPVSAMSSGMHHTPLDSINMPQNYLPDGMASINTSPMAGMDIPFELSMGSSSGMGAPLSESQFHGQQQQQPDNIPQMNMMPGIDLGPMNSDLTRWLNAPPGLLMDALGAYLPSFNQARYNQSER